MEKPWQPQRNEQDAPVALLKNFIYYLNLRITRKTIEAETISHSEFPFLSFEALKQILSVLHVQSIHFIWELNRLAEIPSPSILFIHDKSGHLNLGEFVMFFEINRDEIEYLHSRKGWVREDLSDFEKKWSKGVLSVVSIDKPEGEESFEEKENEYEKLKWSAPGLKNVKVLDDFLTDVECDHIIKLAQPLLKPSATMGEQNIIDVCRTSFSAELVFPHDLILNNIRARAAKILEAPENNFEYFQCVSYDKTQEYCNHYDTFNENSERGKLTIELGGQRKYTLLAYLNDDFEGGGTYFPNLDLLVHPKKNRVLIFNNLDEEGKVLKEALHAGLPVTSGRKYAINMWVRTKAQR